MTMSEVEQKDRKQAFIVDELDDRALHFLQHLGSDQAKLLSVGHHGMVIRFKNDWVIRIPHGADTPAVRPLLRACVAALAARASSYRMVSRPPGARLDSFASFFFSKRTYVTVLKPCLAEMQEEYCEALSEDRLLKARWVRARGVACFWSNVLLQVPVSVTRLAAIMHRR